MDYFEGFREWDAVKWLFIAFHVILTFVGPPLLYFIVWYENYGCNAHYRTVVNILLSHSCSIILHLCLWARFPYVIMQIFGPYPTFMCEMTIMLTKWGFLCIVTEVSLWQLMKYLYIFHWRNVVSMDDDFLAFFLTMNNLLLNGIFTIFMYMIGLANVEVEYHICTGRNPVANLNETKYSVIYLSKSENLFKTLTDSDFTLYHHRFFVVLLILTSTRIWAYDNKPKMKRCYAKLVSIIKGSHNGCIVIANLPENDTYDYYSKTKSVIIGAGGSLLIGILISLFLLPPYFAKKYVSANIDSVNFGLGRTFFYLSRISLTLLRNCSLSVVCFYTSPEIRRCFWRQLKALLNADPR